MVGLLCAMFVRPHTVDPEGIRVRGGLEIDVAVPWSAVASIAIHNRVDEPQQPRVTERERGPEYAERVQHETNIEIELEHPLPIRLPGLAPRGGEHHVTAVRLWADDPRRLLNAARPFLLTAE